MQIRNSKENWSQMFLPKIDVLIPSKCTMPSSSTHKKEIKYEKLAMKFIPDCMASLTFKIKPLKFIILQKKGKKIPQLCQYK
jgi:hypothetical protein